MRTARLAGILLLGSCAVFDPELSSDQLAEMDRRSESYPEEIRKGYALYRRRCSECHSIAKSAAAQMPPDRWARVVRRMARKSGSGIAEEEIGPIAAFLEHHSRR